METQLMAGLWRTTITSPLNLGNAAADDRHIYAIVDDMYANALVLDDGKQEVALVSVDVIGVPNAVAKDILERVARDCGIPATHVTISATHTHASPHLVEEGNDSYTEVFKQLVVTAVFMAQKNKQPARIGVGRGRNENHVFNRRLKRPDGRVVMNWVYTEEDIAGCGSDGVVDPEMLVLKIDDRDGRPLGFIINYANHNNVVHWLTMSSDIAGAMARMLRGIYGDDVVTLFLLGACGNTNWLNHRGSDHPRDPALHKRIAAGQLGTVLQMIPRLEYPEITDIAVAGETLTIAEKPCVDYDTLDDGTFGPGGVFDFILKAAEEGRGKPLTNFEVVLRAVRLGKDIVIATNPCELFADYGLEMKAKSPFKYTLVVELTNGSVGYVPTLNAYTEGGYEVRKPASRVERDAGGRITTATVRLLERLSRE